MAYLCQLLKCLLVTKARGTRRQFSWMETELPPVSAERHSMPDSVTPDRADGRQFRNIQTGTYRRCSTNSWTGNLPVGSPVQNPVNYNLVEGRCVMFLCTGDPECPPVSQRRPASYAGVSTQPLRCLCSSTCLRARAHNLNPVHGNRGPRNESMTWRA